VAQKIQTIFTDDLDGSEAEETVRFGLDGVDYEIDLSADHAEQLRKALAKYVGAGRKISGSARRPSRRSGRQGVGDGSTASDVREWAKSEGIEVKERGRVPAELIVKFQAATGG
jgi:Lsr2